MRAPRRPGFWRPFVLAAVLAVLTVTLALIWGTVLKKKSDAYREALEANAWTIDIHAPAVPSVTVREFRGPHIAPGASLNSVTANKAYNGVALTLSPDDSGILAYALPLSGDVALSVAGGAPSLGDEVSRLHKANLTVSGVFRVRCLDDSFSADPALAARQRGLELGLLLNIADAGVDDILLVGLPYGNDAADIRTLAFLEDLKEILGYASRRPAIGVSLKQDGFAVRIEEADEQPDGADPEEVLYAGHMTPGRMLIACDFLVLDLRGMSSDQADEALSKLQYAYTRYALRLLSDQPEVIAKASDHGFTRIMEWT